MNLAVLNNRLLQITDRRFTPHTYGASDFRAFVAMLAPDVRLIHEGNFWRAELVTSTMISTDATGVDVAKNGPPPGAHPGQASSLTGRIRRDLWTAVMDFASGRTYVWDEKLGSARIATHGELQPRMPTITPVELSEWRQTFLEQNAQAQALDPGSVAQARRWHELGLATHFLPISLQQNWNQELSLRVRQRLQSFFGSIYAHSDHENEAGRSRGNGSTMSALEEEITAARGRGDLFSVGELLARELVAAADGSVDPLLARIVCAWASSKSISIDPQSLAELSEQADSFAAGSLATAFINGLARVQDAQKALPDEANDLAFKLRDDISAAYGVDKRSPTDMCRAAIAALGNNSSDAEAALARFLRTTPATAKSASIELLKTTRRLQAFVVAAERQFLRDLDVLFGPAFRRLCEAYERNDDAEVIRRAPEFLENVKMHAAAPTDPKSRSRFWRTLVLPVLDHLTNIVEEATNRGELALAPALVLRNPSTKADLKSIGTETHLSFSLRNEGKGHARDVTLRPRRVPGISSVTLLEPSGPFDVPPEGEQLIRLGLVLDEVAETLEIPIEWICQTQAGREAVLHDRVLVSQQVTEPDWDALLSSPPYSLNPVRRAERLYGRDSSLRSLRLAAMAGASTFVWGQKRIGKTSLLQVLAAELASRPATTCLLLRMGELTSLHEGQLASLIAHRLSERSGAEIPVPPEASFGAGISQLIPFAEKLTASLPDHKFIVIIDEFDDLDPAFYTGERGKQFVKGLRSVSEVGLTFFFVGSERMEAIYSRHQADLNKWTNVRLDRIDNRADCRALIVDPVAGVIEYAPEAADFITDYTSGNPFYIHNFCYQVFERCLQERRTFVDGNDTQAVRQQLLRALGPTNFSHLWEDNPVLDLHDKRRQAAENCVALSCIALTGGHYESIEDLQDLQESLPLTLDDRARGADLRKACERLVRRNVLVPRKASDGFEIGLAIFREWLAENAVSKLLPVWIEHVTTARNATESSAETTRIAAPPDEAAFPIAEDDMLVVAQRLIYCGRQKDVAEIRTWLRQFDDDGRIEIAFSLLKRLSERGFINEGLRAHGLQKLEEMVKAKRQMVGGKSWTIVRGRSDNLCLGYVDSDHKSGGSTARELQKMLRPGKIGPAIELEGWMKSHQTADAMVVIVDDFAGTGETLTKGIQKFKSKIADDLWQTYTAEHRICLYVMFAFPEALEAVRKAFPHLEVVAATVLGDELRGCEEAAEIFPDEAERRFAEDVLQQIGRELTPSAPLGFGNMGALVVFHNGAPNNTLPIFWSAGNVGERPWKPLFPRA